jgi:hypothetical protein
MKWILTSLTVFLIISGCGKATGMASTDMESLFITVRPETAASIEGRLAEDVSLEKMVSLFPSTGVTEIRVTCTQKDSSMLKIVADTISIPIYITTSEGSPIPRISVSQNGLFWQPSYCWSVSETGACSIEGLVILSNSTNQVWNAATVRIEDNLGNAVATTSTGLTIPEGEVVVRWWEATGEAGTLSVVYGWPYTGEWNALQPLIVPSAGPLTPDGTREEMWSRPSSDTIYVLANDIVEIREQQEQIPLGYINEVTLSNIDDRSIDIRMIYPDKLPRGASFVPGDSFQDYVTLTPLESRTMRYSLVYTNL